MNKGTFTIVGASLAGAKAAESLREEAFEARPPLSGVASKEATDLRPKRDSSLFSPPPVSSRARVFRATSG
jgi:hypothetical protein